MTIQELQNEFLSSREKIIDAKDFFILLAYSLKKEKTFFFTHPEYTLTTLEEKKIRKNIQRRIQHEPIAYITGTKEFYGYNFSVTRDTLIPRPETEQMVELALQKIQEEKNITVIDIGTGSGNIIISLARKLQEKSSTLFSQTYFFALDISKDALKVAKKNAKENNVHKKILFSESDLLSHINKKNFSEGTTFLILANLPYVSPALYQKTSPDIRSFEPITALVSEEAGLSHYYRLLKQRTFFPSSSDVSFLLEISPEQTRTLTHFVSTLFPHCKIQIYKDLAKKNRIASLSHI